MVELFCFFVLLFGHYVFKAIFPSERLHDVRDETLTKDLRISPRFGDQQTMRPKPGSIVACYLSERERTRLARSSFEKEAENWQVLFNQLPEGILMIESDNEYSFFNESLRKLMSLDGPGGEFFKNFMNDRLQDVGKLTVRYSNSKIAGILRQTNLALCSRNSLTSAFENLSDGNASPFHQASADQSQTHRHLRRPSHSGFHSQRKSVLLNPDLNLERQPLQPEHSVGAEKTCELSEKQNQATNSTTSMPFCHTSGGTGMR